MALSDWRCEAERERLRDAARAQRKADALAWAPVSSLGEECARFADEVDGGWKLVLLSVLYSEDWSRPPQEVIAKDQAAQLWDQAMRLKTEAEYALAHACQLTGRTDEEAFHLRRAEIGYPRVFWQTDAQLDYQAKEHQRRRAKLSSLK